MMLFMILFHQLCHIMFDIISCHFIRLCKFYEFFFSPIVLSTQSSTTGWVKGFLFPFQFLSLQYDRNRNCKSESEKKESNFCRFREYFNKLPVHLFICVPPTQTQIRSSNLCLFFDEFHLSFHLSQQGPLRPSGSNISSFVKSGNARPWSCCWWKEKYM